LEKTHIGNENNFRRKDSTFGLEHNKNSFFDHEYTGFEKSKNSKKLIIGIKNNKKVEFKEDDNSSEEDDKEGLYDSDTIFNLEIESSSTKQQQPQQYHTFSLSPSLSSSFLNSFYHIPNINTNKNLSFIKQNIKDYNIRNISNNNSNSYDFNYNYNYNFNNLTRSNNSNRTNTIKFNYDGKMNQSPNSFIHKMINYHLNNGNTNELSSSLKSNKNNLGNKIKELKFKETPIKYNGHNNPKPVIKKNNVFSSERKGLKLILDEQVKTKSNHSSILRKEKTITYPIRKKKSVRFKNENEECPFKKFECPSNIVNLPIYVVDSQLEPFLEVKLVMLEGFQTKKKVSLPWDKNVILESVGLISDETQEQDIVKLIIQVRNIAFEKKVKVHYSLDNWKSVNIKEASYYGSKVNERQESIDRFLLKINTVGDDKEENVSHLQFAIQYLVDQREFWDNNNGKNYSLKIERTVRIPAKSIKSHRNGKGPVIRYKLKPGYHYPIFKSNINEHPSADISKKEEEGKKEKEKKVKINSQAVVPNLLQRNAIHLIERSSIENILSSSDNNNYFSTPTTTTNISINSTDISTATIQSKSKENQNEIKFSEEEKIENPTSNNGLFSWNDPILLGKSKYNKNQNQNITPSNTKLINNSIIRNNFYSLFENLPFMNKNKKREEKNKIDSNQNDIFKIKSNSRLMFSSFSPSTSSISSSLSPSPSLSLSL
jgi:hypothetical protein